jgi:hypothetical protein
MNQFLAHVKPIPSVTIKENMTAGNHSFYHYFLVPQGCHRFITLGERNLTKSLFLLGPVWIPHFEELEST